MLGRDPQVLQLDVLVVSRDYSHEVLTNLGMSHEYTRD